MQKSLPTVAARLLVQSDRVILTNVCNWRRSSIGEHAASPRKPNLGADSEDTPSRQINWLSALPGIDRADSRLDHRSFLWRQLFLSNASVGETGARCEPEQHQP